MKENEILNNDIGVVSEKKEQKVKKKGKSTLKKVGVGILGVTTLLCGTVVYIFRDDIRTIQSVEMIDEYGLYYMEYYSDYGLDKLIAQGGAENDVAIVEFTIKQVLKGLPVEFEVPDFGCTTFQVQNAEGDWLMGRNYDLDYVPSMIIKTTPENGYSSIAVGNMSILMYDEVNRPTNFANSVITLASPYIVMDGLNEMGLSIAVLMIEDEATFQTGNPLSMTTTSAIRYILDKAKDVDEAISLLENMNMRASSNTSYHYQIADSSGNSAIIEYIDHELSVIRKGEQPMLLTNFLVSEEKYGFGKGHDRYDLVLEELERTEGIMESADAMKVLEMVENRSYDPVTGDGSDTQWSVVYNNSDLTLDICVGGQFDTVYSFSLFD